MHFGIVKSGLFGSNYLYRYMNDPDAIFSAASQQGHAQHLMTQDAAKNERYHNGGI